MASPSPRQRATGTAAKWGIQTYITYADWKGLPAIINATINNYGKVDRFVHKSRSLITTEPAGEPAHRTLDLPRFNPEIKQGFYGVGDENAAVPNQAGALNTEAFYTKWLRGNYWLSNHQCLNWDADDVYINGEINRISTIDESPIKRKNCIVCCAYGAAITADDLTAWSSSNTAAIGKAKVIIVMYDGVQSKFFISIYAENLLGVYPANTLYTREIPATDYAKAFNFVFIGFKTDGKTLVFHKSTYSAPTNPADIAEGGVFKMEFNDTYTSETVTKLDSHHFAQLTRSSSYSNTYPEGGGDGAITGSGSEILSDKGHHVLNIYHHKDDFTVIVEKIAEYAWTESYNQVTASGVTSSTVSGSYRERRDYCVYRIDFDTNSVVDCNKIVTSYWSAYTYGSSDVGGVGSSFTTFEKDESENKILFANHALDFYIYRTTVATGGATASSDGINLITETLSTLNFKLIVDKKGTLEIIDHNEDTNNLNSNVVGGLVAHPRFPYQSLGATYESEPFFLDTAKNYAFDGTLAICCVDLSYSNIGTLLSFRHDLRTLIYNVKTDARQLMDYRVDNPTGGDRVYPLTVTAIPKI
jgi:hypothetical protein